MLHGPFMSISRNWTVPQWIFLEMDALIFPIVAEIINNTCHCDTCDLSYYTESALKVRKTTKYEGRLYHMFFFLN